MDAAPARARAPIGWTLQVACGQSLPRLSRHPIHGAPKWKPSGIRVAMVFDHGAVVSSGFPSSDAGRGPAAPADVRSRSHATVSVDGCRTMLTAALGAAVAI